MAKQERGRAGEATPREREMRALVAQWERSGLTRAQFARLHGLAPTTLSWWSWAIRRRERDRAAATPAAFVGVHLVDGPVSASKARPFEVVLPGRRVVRVPPGFDAQELSRLLSALGGAAC